MLLVTYCWGKEEREEEKETFLSCKLGEESKE